MKQYPGATELNPVSEAESIDKETWQIDRLTLEYTTRIQRLFRTHRINREVATIPVIAVGNHRQFSSHLIDLIGQLRDTCRFQFH